MKNIKKFEINNIDQALSMYQKGVSRRETGSTKMNAESSRSHLIFTVEISYLNQREMIVNGRLNLIDLAGSERIKESIDDNNPNRKKLADEAISINKSLMQLGQMITQAISKDSNKAAPQ